MLLSATLNGPPRAFQEARSPSLVRRPNSHARFPPIRSPILATVASSPYGIPQPPSANPSRVSSSGRPGPCITPSSVTQFITITFPISSPLLLLSHLLFFSHLISCSSVSARHPRARPVDSQDPRVIPASHPLHERDRPKSTPPPKSPTRAPCTAAFPRRHVFSGRSRASRRAAVVVREARKFARNALGRHRRARVPFRLESQAG